ncbi:MAG: NusG domain II-containing protein [Firmicutes bacterium]|nr:NusG domain II-containing protein [Bacillota bacterium]
MEKLRLKAADYVVIAVLLLAGCVGLWLNLQRSGTSERKYLTIHVDNEAVAELSFTPDDQFTYSFPYDQGRHEAVLEIEGGRVRMLPLPQELCPRGICSHTGWIGSPYESIVCLPNRIMVIFSQTPKGRDNDIDSITF